MRASTRVAHVTTAHPHTDNRILRKECTAIAAAGIEVWLVAVAPADEERHGVRISALPRRAGRIRRMVLGPVDAWRALRRIEPALVHVHDPELVPLAILWRLLHRRPAVFDAHEDLPKQVAGKPYLHPLVRPLVSMLAAGLERAADRLLDGVVAATPSIARNFTRTRVTLVQNFPWLSDFPAPAPWPTTARPTLCYVGGITEGRGGMEMLEVVRGPAPAPELVLAGAVSSAMATAIAADDTGRVRYEGLVPVERIPAVIASAHTGLVLLHPLPNYIESQPTKVFEYMAAGRPFIASSFPAWRDLLGPHRCGFFVDPSDRPGLVALVQRIEDSPEEARAMGARGREAFVRHFTFENEAVRLVAITRSLVER